MKFQGMYTKIKEMLIINQKKKKLISSYLMEIKEHIVRYYFIEKTQTQTKRMDLKEEIINYEISS